MQRIHKFYITCLLALLLFAPFVWMEGTKPARWVSAQGGTTVFTNVRVTQDLRLQQRDSITVTYNGLVNPTGSNQQLTAAFPGAATSGANIDVQPAGTLLVLTNVSTNTIVFTETGSLISAGNISLGANDSATLLSDGDSWRQIAASNN